MSGSDSFIEEVTEEVRRDKLFLMFRRYGWIALLVVVGIVGYAAWQEYSAAQRRASDQAFGDAVLAAQANNDPAAQVKALEAIPAAGGRAAVLHFLTASAAVDAGDTKAAMAALDAVAADASLPVDYRDLAALKRVMVAGEAMTPEEKAAALAPLAAAGHPYRPLALEQIALLAVAKGDTADAIKQFRAILQEPQLTAGLRRRASAMIVALGGDLAAS